MFGFDERYAMFDITPVENQFILEYLPSAKGDYVKVYLYGLMRCYHPEENLSPESVARELNMTVETVQLAFGYWERRGLVRRISDQPPCWQYVNIKQLNTDSSERPDPAYDDFCKAIYDVFGGVRRLHGSELSKCYEWQEDLHLPTEVILMLLNHMAAVKGKNFKMSDAEKLAMQMDTENIRTVETAEEFFLRDEIFYSGVKKILKLLGKRYLPSDAQVSLYRKWIMDWHFSPDTIEAATELTAKGDPSLGYLDGILASIRTEYGDGAKITPAQIRDSTQRTDELRTVLKKLGKGEITPGNLELYDRMKALYPQDVILIAAEECSHSSKGPEEMMNLLQSWKDKGLENTLQIRDYIDAFHEQTALIRELRGIWGSDPSRIGKTDRSLVRKWEQEMGFSKDMILSAAAYAAEAKNPMAYLDKILSSYEAKGIKTPEAAAKERKNGGLKDRKSTQSGKTVIAQQYSQRDYRDVQEQMMNRQQKEILEFLNRNGGKPDA